jgi:para-nitrobenzyl esterase
MARCDCSTIDEFRAIPPEKLFSVWQQAKKEIKGGNASTFPVKDGYFVTANSQPKNIAYMGGSTSHDMAPPILYSLTKKWLSSRQGPAYCWYFDRLLPGDDCGAWHSSDLWYWFGTLANCWRPMEAKDRDLSRQMVTYLCNFCKTGNPNGEGLVKWDSTKQSPKHLLHLGERETQMDKPSMLKMVKIMMTNKAVGE